MGRAILSKYLIQFSLDETGGALIPLSLLFDLKPNHNGDNEVNGDLLQGSPYFTAAPVPTNLQQAYTGPHLYHADFWTLPGLVWVNLLLGLTPSLLSPGAHVALFVPSKSLFTQSCVSSGSSIVGLMVTFQEEACHTGLLHPCIHCLLYGLIYINIYGPLLCFSFCLIFLFFIKFSYALKVNGSPPLLSRRKICKNF